MQKLAERNSRSFAPRDIFTNFSLPEGATSNPINFYILKILCNFSKRDFQKKGTTLIHWTSKKNDKAQGWMRESIVAFYDVI